ncbi:hypothetical protein P4R16_001029 [Klebsiella oxytoca]|uniref:hypothetical protein n=1 Tax=Klebsiella oxytoca TaxID=571 RepID=UPI0011DD5351|nr:hypothetical protein [Klebsiella oxytoca]EKT7900139.1 hypothetical protein [Klebsiella oxytoca]TXU75866.1 hypothetical protein D4N05_09155 [Klebsiella oxytoca]
MNHTLSDSQLEAMVKSAVNSFGPLPPDEKFSQLISALRELQERRKAEQDSEPVAEVCEDYAIRYISSGPAPKEGLHPGDKLYRHAQQPVVPDNSAITQHFDTIALETAREIMCDVNRRHEFLGGEIQLLSRIQCRIDAACRAAMLNGGKS